MPVEIRELIIKASIEQSPQKDSAIKINDELIEKIKYEIRNEIISEMKEKFNEIIYNK
jgi:hypothetical protein